MDNSIDQQFVEFVVKSLVGNPDAVKVDRRIDEKGVLLELTVDPEDLGRVIGKRGATAQSLRTLLRALGTKNEARYNLKIVDNGEPRPPRDDVAAVSEDGDNSARPAPTTQTVADDDSAVSAVSDDSRDLSDLTDDDDVASSNSDSDHSDAVSKTRRELEELDDLDI